MKVPAWTSIKDPDPSANVAAAGPQTSCPPPVFLIVPLPAKVTLPE